MRDLTFSMLLFAFFISPVLSNEMDRNTHTKEAFTNQKVDQLLHDARNLRSLILSNLVFSADKPSQRDITLYEVAKNSMTITTESLSIFSKSTQQRVKFLFLSAGIGKKESEVTHNIDSIQFTDERNYNKALRLVSRLQSEYLSVLRQISSLAPSNYEFVYMVSQDIFVSIKRGHQQIPLISLKVANSLLSRSGRVICPHKDILSPSCDVYERYDVDLKYTGLGFKRSHKLMKELNDYLGYDYISFY